jgi:hypothetical protein
VASAFISYAHEDQEFMLALVEPLQAQGLDIRYDRVVLNIGDSFRSPPHTTRRTGFLWPLI